MQSEIGTHRSRIEFNRQRAEELTELIERARKDIAAAEAKRTQQHKEIEQANALVEKTHQLVHAKESELTKLTDSISKLRADRAEQETELEALEATVSKNEERIEELQNDPSGITIRRETTRENQRDLDTAISEANTNRAESKRKLRRRGLQPRKPQKDVDLLKSEAQTREETLQQHQQLLAEIEKKPDRDRARANRKRVASGNFASAQ